MSHAFAILLLLCLVLSAEAVQPTAVQKENRIQICQRLFQGFLDGSALKKYEFLSDQMDFQIREWIAHAPRGMEGGVIANYADGKLYWLHLSGIGRQPKIRVLLSAGVHGDEPGGVAALLAFLKEARADPFIREHFDIWVIPAVNRSGLEAGTRETAAGIDLNRMFGTQGQLPLIDDLRSFLKGRKFDLTLDLHEAKRDGTFAIAATRDDHGLAQAALKKTDERFLLKAQSGQYPEPLYMHSDPSRQVYELYSPGHTVSSNEGTMKSYSHVDLGVLWAYTLEGSLKIPVDQRVIHYTQLIHGFLQAAFEKQPLR